MPVRAGIARGNSAKTAGKVAFFVAPESAHWYKFALAQLRKIAA
jgi:hypothetical protein